MSIQSMPDVEHNLRDEFLLSSDVVFLNHGSFGACPRPVFEVYQDWQLELQHQPVEFLGRRFPVLMQTVREALGSFLHARPDELVYVPNATTGLNVIARSLPLQPGDEVLGTDHEYGAIDRTWQFICARRGAHYIRQPLPLPFESATQVIESIWSGVTKRTRVLFLSHITSPTALILPVGELVQRAREAGIWTVIDGAHAPGQIPLDFTVLEVDFYVGNLHKWLCSPPGSGFLYARKEMQHLLEPLVVSWGWKSSDPGPSQFIDEQEWQGTRDIAAYLSAPAAIEFQAEHDWPRVQARCHYLLQRARHAVVELTGLPALSPDSPEWYAQMAAFPLAPCDAEELKQRLYDVYRIEVPIITWNERQLVRVSIQAYNTQEDVDALVEALTMLKGGSIFGQRSEET